MRDRRVQHKRRRAGRGHVGDDGDKIPAAVSAQPRGEGVEAVGAPRDADDDADAEVAEERLAERRADARARAGDDGDAVLEAACGEPGPWPRRGRGIECQLGLDALGEARPALLQRLGKLRKGALAGRRQRRVAERVGRRVAVDVDFVVAHVHSADQLLVRRTALQQRRARVQNVVLEDKRTPEPRHRRDAVPFADLWPRRLGRGQRAGAREEVRGAADVALVEVKQAREHGRARVTDWSVLVAAGRVGVRVDLGAHAVLDESERRRDCSQAAFPVHGWKVRPEPLEYKLRE
mmetsp:Transcript_15759/g.53091  ORF Transcript_15759/g.53091 Transcript_15759/m.53091 type:complete len:292 (-) Transcript_15759:57-932(-)